MNYYGMNGEPISRDEWIQQFENPDRILAHTHLPGGCLVSTVWLGIDYSFGMGGPLLIFESMVFGPDDGTDLDCRRYSTREEAEAGHSELVTQWTGWTPGEDYPEGAVRSPISALLDAVEAGTRRPMTPQESLQADAMVVMYPKDIAERMEEDP